MEKNPFTLMYGMTTNSVIAREEEISKIIKAFTYDENMLTYLITGIRGSGKTVLLKTIEKRLSLLSDWVIVNINPQGDICVSLANRLSSLDVLRRELSRWSVSINLGVITLARESGEQITDPEIIIDMFLAIAKKLKMKVLVSIDEVNNTKEFRKFINLYQILIGKEYPLFLLMTALAENISGLANNKGTTFLSRAPKIVLEPLDLPSVALEYMKMLNVEKDKAIEMAKLTNGYAFAFQVLGYFYFESKEKELNAGLIDQYQEYLWNNGYNKFWKDLAKAERRFLIALSSSHTKQKSEIIGADPGFKDSYSVYRARLMEKGLLFSPSYNKLDFVLPRFEEFVDFVKDFE